MRNVAKENLKQIESLLNTLSKPDYVKKPEILSGASIGQHVRHILEFYLLLVSGSFTGTISYDKRERDKRLEIDPEFALNLIENLFSGLDTVSVEEKIILEADYTSEGHNEIEIVSTVGRELAYCIEHSIHHQAIIKAGLIAMGLADVTDANFGVAYSTIRYRNN